EPVNMKLTGRSEATIGEVNGARLTFGAIAGISRTTKVVLTFTVTKSGSLRLWKNLNVAAPVIDRVTNDPHGVLGLPVPVHCQLSVEPENWPARNDPPGPNCTVATLLVGTNVYPGGVVNEMLPATWKVRLTVGTDPGGSVSVTKTCGKGMMRLANQLM